MTDIKHLIRRLRPCVLARSGVAVWLFVLLSAVGNKAVALPVDGCTSPQGLVCESSNECPAWQDIGLEDILLVDSQPTTPTPRPAKPFGSQLFDGGKWPAAPHYCSLPAGIGEELTPLCAPGCNIYSLCSLRL